MSELRLNTDGHIIKFGADNDVSLTHVADTGLLLNSTMQLQFNDASQNINAPSATVLDINATDEIELNATLVDINANVEISGTATTTGVHTFSAAPVFPDGSIAVADLDIDGATDIGAAVVDADLFIVDDGAGGTNRKVTASRLKTYAAFNADAAQVFNESGADVDFRIEADDTTHMFFVDASEDKIGINQPSPLGILHVRGGGADFGGSIESTANLFVLDNSGHGGMTIGSGSAHTCTINFGDSEDSDIGSIVYNNSGDTMAFTTNTNERMRILNSGELCVGKTSSDAGVVGGEIRNTGNLVGSVSGNTCLFLNRSSDDGVIVDFKQANSTEGTVSVSGSTVSYNAFAGSHWSRLADNSKPTILRGTVMESIATMCDWYNVKFTKDGIERTEEIGLPDGKSVGDSIKYTFKGVEYDGVLEANDNERLPMCKISDTADSKAVYGVFMDWDSDDDTVNDMYVTSLGAFVVRVHKDETVAIGNWLVSKGDGTAKVLAGNTAITADVQSSLIGKVTSTTKTHTHADGSYCVPCTLHCG